MPSVSATICVGRLSKAGKGRASYGDQSDRRLSHDPRRFRACLASGTLRARMEHAPLPLGGGEQSPIFIELSCIDEAICCFRPAIMGLGIQSRLIPETKNWNIQSVRRRRIFY